jgi:steroid delta-isomerase-like uncharacterized protein
MKAGSNPGHLFSFTGSLVFLNRNAPLFFAGATEKSYLPIKVVSRLLESSFQLYSLTQKINAMKKILFSFLAVITFSCNNSVDSSMSKKSADNKAKTQRFYDDVINGHNTAMIDSFCAADFTDHNPSQGHSGKGIADLHAMFNEMLTAFPDMKATVDFMVAQGDTVVSYVTMTGTNSGAMGNMPATNKSIKINGIDIIAIKDGKATDRWGVFDDMSMMSQLGMIPSGDTSMNKK